MPPTVLSQLQSLQDYRHEDSAYYCLPIIMIYKPSLIVFNIIVFSQNHIEFCMMWLVMISVRCESMVKVSTGTAVIIASHPVSASPSTNPLLQPSPAHCMKSIFLCEI